jgi:GTPase
MELFNSLIISSSLTDVLLKCETDDGNVEYKLRLDTKSKLGKKKLVSQMNFRLEEGKRLTKTKKEAHYILGINDDGTLGKLNEKQIDETFSVFVSLVTECGATITHIDKKKYDNFYIMYVIIQKIGKNKITEINVAFVGPSQHGKTTTISHLVYNQHDDGNGYARKLIFKYEHEKITGLTSSIKREIVGFCGNNLVNYSTGMLSSWENIVEMSDKIVNLIDLPGSSKYVRTSLFGLSTYKIDCLFIVLDYSKITKEDLSMVDFYQKYAQFKKIQYHIINIQDIYNDDDIIGEENHIKISNKSMLGFDKLVNTINEIEESPNKDIYDVPEGLYNIFEGSDNIFSVADTYFISESGTIYSGIMNIGSLSINDPIYITNGKDYVQSKIKSIHKKTIDSQSIYEGETGAIQLDFDKFHQVGTITTKKYDIHNKLFFRPMHMIRTGLINLESIYPEFKNQLDKMMLRSLCLQSLLFVGNVIGEIYPSMALNSKVIFEYDKTIFPLINSTQPVIAFVKNIYGIYIGELSMI